MLHMQNIKLDTYVSLTFNNGESFLVDLEDTLLMIPVKYLFL